MICRSKSFRQFRRRFPAQVPVVFLVFLGGQVEVYDRYHVSLCFEAVQRGQHSFEVVHCRTLLRSRDSHPVPIQQRPKLLGPADPHVAQSNLLLEQTPVNKPSSLPSNLHDLRRFFDSSRFGFFRKNASPASILTGK
jgi:hypothetical protein